MDNKKDKIILIGILIVVLFLASYIIIASQLKVKSEGVVESKQNSLQALTNKENNVEFQVTPLNPSEFEVSMNTHSVELDFDVTQISALYDDLGNEYKPLKWDGSAPEGHHREGILKFPSINKNAKSIKLVINDGTKREFSWDIR